MMFNVAQLMKQSIGATRHYQVDEAAQPETDAMCPRAACSAV